MTLTIENVNYVIKKIETVVINKPDTPQFILKNTRNKDITIFSITLLPNTRFTTDGNLTVSIYGTTNNTLTNIRFGDLEGVSSAIINLGSDGINFRKNDELRFFIWRNGVGATIRLTVDITIGEKIVNEDSLVNLVNYKGTGFQRSNRR